MTLNTLSIFLMVLSKRRKKKLFQEKYVEAIKGLTLNKINLVSNKISLVSNEKISHKKGT